MYWQEASKTFLEGGARTHLDYRGLKLNEILCDKAKRNCFLEEFSHAEIQSAGAVYQPFHRSWETDPDRKTLKWVNLG